MSTNAIRGHLVCPSHAVLPDLTSRHIVVLGRPATIPLARVLARVRSEQGRTCVLGVLFTLLALVPLAHASPPDPMWIAGIYDAGDFDEVVCALIGADTISPPAQLTAIALLLLVDILTEVRVSPVVAVVSAIVRPRSPPHI